MNNSEIFVGLDIGTSSIKVVVAKSTAGKIDIIGVGSNQSEGISSGVIVDIDKASNAIKNAIDKAEKQANLKIDDVVINVPSNNLEILPCQGMIAIGTEAREINEDDVMRVMSASMVSNSRGEREIVTLKPTKFTVDGFNNIRDPRGMIGVRLEMKGVVYTAPKNMIYNLQMAVQKAGLNISHEVVAPLALSKIALSEGERNFGSVIIEMGAGQTSASVIHEKNLKMTYVDFEGGNHITHDISVVLNTNVENASHYKIYYGNADSSSVSKDDVFSVEVVGENEPTKIQNFYLSEIIEARVEQLFNRLKNKLEETNALDLPGGIIITGGVAATPGIDSLAEKIFNTKAKVYTPEQVGLRYPSFSVGLGEVYYAAMLSDIDKIANMVVLSTNNLFSETSDNGNRNLNERSIVHKFSLGDSNNSSKNKEKSLRKKFEQDKSVKEKNESTKSTKKVVKNLWNMFFE